MVKAKRSTERGYKLPKGMSEAEAQLLDKRLNDKVDATPGRKRPRNQNEVKALKRWEAERGGKPIGDIGGGVDSVAKDHTKQTLSAKVPAELKQKVKDNAAEQGQTVSEYIAAMLRIDWSAKEEVHKAEVDELKRQLQEKETLILRLTDSLEREQNLVDQQQQLQLQSQQRVKELEEKQQLLIESKSSRKWWQFWSQGGGRNE